MMSESVGVFLFYAGLALIPCAVQMLFCFLVKKKVLKCIPIYIIVLCFVLCILMTLGVFGDIPLGDIEIHGFVGLLLMFFVGIAAGGVALAWAIYGITLLVQRKSSSQSS